MGVFVALPEAVVVVVATRTVLASGTRITVIAEQPACWPSASSLVALAGRLCDQGIGYFSPEGRRRACGEHLPTFAFAFCSVVRHGSIVALQVEGSMQVVRTSWDHCRSRCK